MIRAPFNETEHAVAQMVQHILAKQRFKVIASPDDIMQYLFRITGQEVNMVK